MDSTDTKAAEIGRCNSVRFMVEFSQIVFNLRKCTLFEAGDLRLTDADFARDLHLGASLKEAQVQDALLALVQAIHGLADGDDVLFADAAAVYVFGYRGGGDAGPCGNILDSRNARHISSKKRNVTFFWGSESTKPTVLINYNKVFNRLRQQ